MRAASSAWITRGALAAAVVALVACGGASLRRSLVTDQTPLGSTRAHVRAWFAANGWCGGAAPGRWKSDDRDVYRPCSGPDRHRIVTDLWFARDRLFFAWVYVRVPSDESPSTTPIWFGVGAPSTVSYEPGSGSEPPSRPPGRRPMRDSDDSRVSAEMAAALIDALSVEIEARYGKPCQREPMRRVWKTRRESIYMRVHRGWIVEAHAHSFGQRCSPAPE